MNLRFNLGGRSLDLTVINAFPLSNRIGNLRKEVM